MKKLSLILLVFLTSFSTASYGQKIKEGLGQKYVEIMPKKLNWLDKVDANKVRITHCIDFIEERRYEIHYVLAGPYTPAVVVGKDTIEPAKKGVVLSSASISFTGDDYENFIWNSDADLFKRLLSHLAALEITEKK